MGHLPNPDAGSSKAEFLDDNVQYSGSYNILERIINQHVFSALHNLGLNKNVNHLICIVAFLGAKPSSMI
jgi:hypothetical protein